MSKKIMDPQSEGAELPFFAHLLTSQSDPAQSTNGGGAPSYPCIDTLCTKKYPSDDDESTTWFKDSDG